VTRLRLAIAAVALTLVLGLVLTVATGGGEAPSSNTSAAKRGAAPQTQLSDASALYMVEVSGGTPRLMLRPEAGGGGSGHDEEPGQIDTPSYSPDGLAIAYTQTDCEYCESRLHIAPANAPARSRELQRLRNPYQASWGSDGRRLAVLQPAAGIAIVDARTGASRMIVPKRTRSLEAPAWSPADQRILFTEQVDATNWDIYVVRAGGGRPVRLTSTAAQETGPTWSPDGRLIAFARADPAGTWRVYTMSARGGRATPATPRRMSAVEPAWPPDGRRLAVTTQKGNDSSIRLVSLHGGKPVRITAPNLFASQPAWSSDGRRLIFIARGLEAVHGPRD
jgi:Tol biopolymer transport system component